MLLNRENRLFILILCFGLFISFTVFSFLLNWEEDRRLQEFKYKAQDHAAAIQTEFEHLVEKVANVRFLIEHDINIEHDNPSDPDDFMPMSEKIIINDATLLNVIWAIQDNKDTLKTIYMHSAVQHADWDESFSSHTYHVSNLNKDRSVSALVQDEGHEGQEIHFIAPVFRSHSAKGIDDQLIGALITEWDINSVINNALFKLPISAQDITLSVIQANDVSQKQEVYFHASRSRTVEEADIHTDLYHRVSFELTGLTWELEFEAAPQFLRNHPIVLAWPSLIFCLLLTFFFLWYMRIAKRQTSIIEKQVIQRTQELAKSEEKVRHILDNLQDVYYQTDVKGAIITMSPSVFALSGFILDEVIGTKMTDYYVDPSDRERMLQLIKNSPQGKTYGFETQTLRKDGSHIWVSVNSQFLYDLQGEIIGIEGTIRDITDKKASEEKLQHLDRVESLGVLAGGIAHDFNNLLTAILGNASLAIKKLDITSPAHHNIESIEHASHSAADLCKQMLAYSGKGKFIVKPINLSELVINMGKLIEVSLAKNVVLKYHLNEQLLAIDADIAQMQQIVLNLITNASEAIEDRSGVISMSTGMMQADQKYLTSCIGNEQHEPGRYIYLEVSDTGCGMSAEIQKKVFDPFFTTKFTGRGLGMSAMLGIVKGHKGALRIYSEVGKGTTIKVAFPVSLEDTVTMNQQTHTDSAWKGSGTILIIDDEETIREVASAMLEDMGFDIITANDGKHGIEVFQEHQADVCLVLLDMTMPKMDGVTCFSELKKIQPDLHVILSSGYNEQDATHRFAGKGLAGFIQKPYPQQLLAEKVQGVLGD